MIRGPRTRHCLIGLCMVGVLACGDATGPARLARSYTLVEAAGRPVPAMLQVFGDPGGVQNGYRLLGRSIEFESGNTVVYSQADDAVTITNAGADTIVSAFSCSRSQGTVTRQGDLVLLHVGGPMPGGWVDTLRLEGQQLVDSISVGVGVRAPIRYSPGRPASRICEPLP